MKSRWLCFWIGFIFSVGCQSSPTESGITMTTNEGTPVDLPPVDPMTLGNVRLAFFSGDRSSMVVLVNKENRLYLAPIAEAQGKAQEELTVYDLEYRCPPTPYDGQTVVRIVEQEVMAQLLALLEYVGFDHYAVTIAAEDLSEGNLPPRDTIILERNGQCSRLTREERLVEGDRQTPQARAYCAIKINMLQAPAYVPPRMLINARQSQLFRRQIQEMEDAQKRLKQGLKAREK